MIDYEKKYNEALERAKSIHNNLNASGIRKEWIEQIFPELAESEDERIRKEIRNFLIDMECKKEWIAYMEKQKEQKPEERFDEARKKYQVEWSEEDEDMFVSVLHFLNTNRINERGKVITWVESLPKRFNLQPKQEWSEEDEEMLEYIIGDVNDAKQLYTTKEAKDMADKEISWLKSLRPSWKPSGEPEYYQHFDPDC